MASWKLYNVDLVKTIKTLKLFYVKHGKKSPKDDDAMMRMKKGGMKKKGEIKKKIEAKKEEMMKKYKPGSEYVYKYLMEKAPAKMHYKMLPPAELKMKYGYMAKKYSDKMPYQFQKAFMTFYDPEMKMDKPMEKEEMMRMGKKKPHKMPMMMMKKKYLSDYSKKLIYKFVNPTKAHLAQYKFGANYVKMVQSKDALMHKKENGIMAPKDNKSLMDALNLDALLKEYDPFELLAAVPYLANYKPFLMKLAYMKDDMAGNMMMDMAKKLNIEGVFVSVFL